MSKVKQTFGEHMIKLVKNISKIATAAVVIKNGVDIYRTGKTLFDTGRKAKDGAGKVNKVLSAVKKGLKS